MVIFLLLASSGIAQSPGSEIGDAVFRPLDVLPDEHAAVYRNSDGSKDWDPMMDLVNTDWRHSVIQATGEEYLLHWQDYETFLWRFSYQAQIGYGFTAPGIDKWERIVIISAARSQYGAWYPKFPEDWRWPYIKFPKEIAEGDPKYPKGSFRCDGLVEYAYEQVFNTKYTDPDDRGFFRQSEEEHCLSIFTPLGLAVRMTPELPVAPFINVSYDPDNDKVIVTAYDGEYGSGIDWIGVYKNKVKLAFGLFNTVYPQKTNLIAQDDKDEDGEKVFIPDIDLFALEEAGEYRLIAVVADRAGNFGVGFYSYSSDD